MKKYSFILLASLISFYVKAQQPVPLPIKSSKPASKAQKYISANETSSKYRPYSFLVEGTDLTAYLKKADPKNSFLHIYFAKMSNNPDTKDVFLAIIGAKENADKKAEHDNSLNSLWCSSTSDQDECLLRDPYLDGPFLLSTPGCKITNCKPNIIPKATVKQYVVNYQGLHPMFKNKKTRKQLDSLYKVKPYLGANATQTFLINANDLIAYLNKPAAKKIKYFQFYIGYNPGSKIANKDGLTIIIVGVDATGNHVYNETATVQYTVLDECNPCPKCSVVNDNDLDVNPQSYY